MKNRIVLAAAALATLGWAGNASADIAYNQDLTSNVIMGSGIGNGGFTTDRANGIELGLRARIPFIGSVNISGPGTYSYDTTDIDSGGVGSWNFDWSVNSNYDGSGPGNLNTLTYLLEFDYDPTAGVTYYDFADLIPVLNGDPISIAYPNDHSIGTNGTSESGGSEATDATNYFTLLATNNVLQNSWRGEWLLATPSATFDPYAPGTYNIRLSAFSGTTQKASTEITVVINGGGGPAVVPVPAAAPLGLLGMGLVAFVRRRKNAKA
ncbi:MAG: hypothetical protein JNK74_01210 [Candidatus Hydrogenedentes bacterium]|nr:hypothetical protein [Candidatus Hydrogenedentota bacterium]